MKKKCNKENCCKYISIIGDCSYCKKEYCLLHRLPEQHICNNIKEIGEKQKELLSKKLKHEASHSKFISIIS